MEDGTVYIHDKKEGRWIYFRRPSFILRADAVSEVPAVLGRVEEAVERDGMYAAGFLSYESAQGLDSALRTKTDPEFPPAWFAFYEDGEHPDAPPFSRTDSGRPLPRAWEPSLSYEEYARKIRSIRDSIRAGDTYQVNFTYRLRAGFSGDPWELFSSLIAAQGPQYGAYLRAGRWTVCSASPELFFRLDGNEFESRPMKGTAPRGYRPGQDERTALCLRHSEKNRAENLMIVDMVRNDMGRIAHVGSVSAPELFTVEKYPTIWQMTSTVRCRTDAGPADIMRALFPGASITGAPKPSTMEIIAELEDSPRGLYTGAIGFFAPGRKAQFNIAIRTVVVDEERRTAEYGVGGGITWDSEEKDEFTECEIKARVLTASPPEFDLFESILLGPEGYFLLESHLSRLQRSAGYFSRPFDRDRIKALLDEAAWELPREPHKLKLIVPEGTQPRVETIPLGLQPPPTRVRLAHAPVDSRNPFLYHKTTHRAHYAGDVLFYNERGEITETGTANIAVERGGVLTTPPIRCGLLAGTFRARLLQEGKLRVGVLNEADIRAADRIYLLNSVRGMWEVTLEQ